VITGVEPVDDLRRHTGGHLLQILRIAKKD
jgi:hypothetical protein